MNTVWKVVLGAALVVPTGAYVAGSLTSSASGDTQPRHTITIRQAQPSPEPGHEPAAHRSPTPSPSASGEVEVITPQYDDLGDDHGGDRSGHGGGDD